MMKAGITILLLCYAMEVVSSFELYSSMDDARNAIMSFYDPTHVERESKPKETKREKTTTTATSTSINWHKKTSILKETSIPKKTRFHGIAEPKFSLTMEREVVVPHKIIWAKPFGKAPKSSGGGGASVSSLGFRGPVFPPHVWPTLKSLPKPISTRVTKKSKPVTSKKRVSLNKFSEAIEDIEKALADAQVVRRVSHNEQRLRRLRDLIKTAVEKRSYRFARKAIGEAMYTIKKINEQR